MVSEKIMLSNPSFTLPNIFTLMPSSDTVWINVESSCSESSHIHLIESKLRH
jgi:hypothetical protein